jgi:hypothetical protein
LATLANHNKRWRAPPSATLVGGARVAKQADAKDLKSVESVFSPEVTERHGAFQTA